MIFDNMKPGGCRCRGCLREVNMGELKGMLRVVLDDYGSNDRLYTAQDSYSINKIRAYVDMYSDAPDDRVVLYEIGNDAYRFHSRVIAHVKGFIKAHG